MAIPSQLRRTRGGDRPQQEAAILFTMLCEDLYDHLNRHSSPIPVCLAEGNMLSFWLQL